MKFCNVNFNIKNKSDLFKRVDENRTKFIITVNAVFIAVANTTKRFFDILNNNHTVFDGKIPHLTARILHRMRSIRNKNHTGAFDFEKLSGSDIVYDFCELASKNNYKVYFLGGMANSNSEAVKVVRERYGIAISGYSPDFENYPFSDEFNNTCLEKIADFKPDILFVGFGAPKQEYWIDDHIEKLSNIGVRYAIGSGGTFDFVSQKIRRAPVFIQKIGLEGVWRLFLEPTSMRVKRLVDSFKFFKYIWRKPDFDTISK